MTLTRKPSPRRRPHALVLRAPRRRRTRFALHALALPLALLLFPAGCGDDSATPPPGQKIVKPDPSLDPSATIRRGPYLNAPSPGTVTVSWTTTEPTSSRVELTPEGGTPTQVEGVVFQPVPTVEDETIAGTLPDGYQHEVTLDGLVAGTRYTYRVLSSGDPKPEGTFTAPPERGDDFSFFLFGDTRSNDDDHAAVISAMTTREASGGLAAFVVHTGDMVTTGGSDSQWDKFFEIEGPLVGHVPMIPVFGNHEALFGRTIFEGLFATPPSSTSPTDRWYSVDIGDIHFTVIDPYSAEIEPHFDWAEQDLADSDAKFKILTLHPPLYTFSNHAPAYDLRDTLLPILQATDVHLVLSGHNHLYERFFGSGIHFVVAGGGGAPLYGADDNLDADNAGATRMAADSSLHYISGRLTGDQLRFEVYSVPDETRIDCFVIDSAQPGVDVGCTD